MPDDNSFVPSESLRRAVELNARGVEFHKNGDLDAAKLHYLAAMLLEPNCSGFVHNVGAILTAGEHHEVGEVLSRRALATAPDDIGARMNLAVCLGAMRRFEESKAEFREVLAQNPADSASWHNYGLMEIATGGLEAAHAAFTKALETPGAPVDDVHNDRAITKLSLGDIQGGLDEYEVRWKKLYRSPAWQCGAPEWKGEPLVGKRILIHGEQGYGDTLMLCRFVPWFIAQGATVTVAAQNALVRLLRRNFPALRVISWDEAVGEFDFHTPMLSMLRWMGVAKPADVTFAPYLSADGLIAPVALPEAPLRVGICWASGDHGKVLRRRRRIVPLEAFVPLLGTGAIRLVSLQKGPGDGDIERIGADTLIFNPMARCGDFADTATIVRDLDLVISVDSAMAHLAGAMGKPVLMLAPYTRCWRWWNTDKKSGRPWYDRMTIIPQSADGSWREAMGIVLTLTQRFMESGKWQRSRAQPLGTISSTPSPMSPATLGL